MCYNAQNLLKIDPNIKKSCGKSAWDVNEVLFCWFSLVVASVSMVRFTFFVHCEYNYLIKK